MDPVVNVDGTIFPCCSVNDSSFIYGDLTKESFSDVWNNEIYKYSGNLLSKEEYSGPKVSSVCDSCRIYKKVK